MTTLITNALLVNEGQVTKGHLLIDGERIADAHAVARADVVIDAQGAYLLPGAIDDHVHFRDPGLTHKGDTASESRAALAGGVTSIMDMPNVVPQTVTNDLWRERMATGARHCRVNYAYHLGATNTNIDEIRAADARRVPGIKLFMGSSTGNMLVDSEQALRQIFRHAPTLIMAHCEDTTRINERMAQLPEGDPHVTLHPWIRDRVACYRSAALAARLAREEGAELHIAHITTAEELALLGGKVTGEACVGHLLLCDEDYPRLGTLMKVNPAIKAASDREALRRAVQDGTITLVGTDHAPHLPADKVGGARRAASGMPMVQFSLVAMLQLFDPCTVARAMCHAPADLFGIEGRGYLRPGYKADLVIVERAPWRLHRADVLSKCGWSPLEGCAFDHRVTHTFVNGRLAYRRGEIDDAVRGQALTFGR